MEKDQAGQDQVPPGNRAPPIFTEGRVYSILCPAILIFQEPEEDWVAGLTRGDTRPRPPGGVSLSRVRSTSDSEGESWPAGGLSDMTLSLDIV